MPNYNKLEITIIALLSFTLLIIFPSSHKSWSISGSGEVISFSNNGQIIAYATGKQIRKQINPEPEKGTKVNLPGTSQIEVRTVNDGKIIQTFDFFSASSIAFSPDDTLMAVGGYGGEIKVWRIENGELIYTFRKAERYRDKTKALLFTPDGDFLIASTVTSNVSDYHVGSSNISVWDLNKGINSNSVSSPFSCAAISNNGQLFALGGNQNTITVHRVKDNVPIQHMSNIPDECRNMFFSHDNKLLISEYIKSYGDAKDEFFVHRISDGKLLRAIRQLSLFRAHHSPTDSKLSPNSNFIATSYSVKPGGGGGLFVYSPNFEPSIGLFGYINFWRVKSGFPFPVATIRAHWMNAKAISFSPDGKWLASMSGGKDNNRIRIWRMPPYSGRWWFLGSIALAILVFSRRNELREWINR